MEPTRRIGTGIRLYALGDLTVLQGPDLFGDLTILELPSHVGDQSAPKPASHFGA